MDYFASDGIFWLPDEPNRRIPGTLTFDPDGLELRLHDSLHAFKVVEGQVTPSPLEWQTVPVVHGRLHVGPDVTLLEASGISMAGPLTETWLVDFVLSGRHLIDGVFDQALFDFDALLPWTRPPGIATDGDRPNTVHADATRVAVVDTVTGAGTRIRLLAGAEGSWDQSRVHLDQWCQFETTGDPRPIRDVLNGWVRPLQDLLIVALGRQVRLTSLLVRPPGAPERDDPLTVSFAAVQPAPKALPTEAEIASYDAPTLITRPSSSIPVEDLLAVWYDTRERLRDVVTLLCGPFYAPFIYDEHRYASTFQAAEALALKLFTTAEKTPNEHQQRVEAVAVVLANSELDEETVKWATAILRGRNDKPLPALIEELARCTGDIGGRILEAVPTFPQDVARARVGVSHGGAKGPDALRRHWLGEVLSWIVRVCLLLEAGLPLDDLVARTLRKPRFGRAVTELAKPT